MSVAAIGHSASVGRLPQTNSPSSAQLKQVDARPNTGAYNNIFRGIPSNTQKLPVSRIPDIVKRMQRDTRSSQAKKGQWYKSDDYVDPRSYSWKNLALFSDYQAQMWTDGGAIKSSYKK